jgi:excisionase family DNA binding protein
VDEIETLSGYYKVAEAAEILRVTPLTIYRAVNEGGLRAVRIGGEHGQLRIPPGALREYARPVEVSA